MTHCFLLATLLGLVLGSHPASADDTRQHVQGVWSVVARFDEDGKPHPVARGDEKHFTFQFTEEQMTMKSKAVTFQAAYKLHPTGMRGTIDVTRTGRGGRLLTFLGIYERDGDSLRICLGGPGEERPTGFRKTEGIEFAVTMQRAKP
jgi:uncharacterized protein (TIGR03067 family)